MPFHKNTCLFCESNGPFTKLEHPIPESLGNDDDVLLPGYVCDNCNQYFGSKIEGPVLNSPPFCIERMVAAVKTKKGKLPWYGQNGKFIMQSTGYWDTIAFDPVYYENNKKLILFPPPNHGNLIARFMLKMGIELLVNSKFDDPYDSRFEKARKFARYGCSDLSWEVSHGIFPNKEELLISEHEDHIGKLETRQLYRYEMGMLSNGDVILSFMLNAQLFACNLISPSIEVYIEHFNKINDSCIKKLYAN
jgi:hypothetical protein